MFNQNGNGIQMTVNQNLDQSRLQANQARSAKHATSRQGVDNSLVSSKVESLYDACTSVMSQMAQQIGLQLNGFPSVQITQQLRAALPSGIQARYNYRVFINGFTKEAKLYDSRNGWFLLDPKTNRFDRFATEAENTILDAGPKAVIADTADNVQTPSDSKLDKI